MFTFDQSINLGVEWIFVNEQQSGQPTDANTY